MNRILWWKVILILAVLVGFSAAVVPTKNNPEPIKRGLDLKGGTHLVMRVNVGDATRIEVDQAMEGLKAQAKKNNLPLPTTRRANDTTFLAMPPACSNARVFMILEASTGRSRERTAAS